MIFVLSYLLKGTFTQNSKPTCNKCEHPLHLHLSSSNLNIELARTKHIIFYKTYLEPILTKTFAGFLSNTNYKTLHLNLSP